MDLFSPQWPPYEALRQRRVLAPLVYAMGPLEVPELAGRRVWWNAFRPMVIPALETIEDQITLALGFWAVAFFGNATAAGLADNGGSFRAQLKDWGVKDDRSDSRLLQAKGKGVNQPNYVCTAQAPYLWRIPFFIPAGNPVGVRVQNRAAVQNTVNVALFGYVDD